MPWLRRLALMGFCLALAVVAGCAPTGPTAPARSQLLRVGPAQVGPLSDDLTADSLQAALGQSLTYLKKLPADRPVALGPDKTTVGGLVWSLEETLRLLERHGLTPPFFQALASDFVFYGAADQVLFTGYYEPVLEARTKPEGRFTRPLLTRPEDLVTVNLADFGRESGTLRGRLAGRRLVPYYTRAEIERGALAGKNLELAYVDPVEAFFLQIQGSGRVRFPDGRQVLVNFAEQNGHSYVSLGQVLIQRGLLTKEEVSLQSLKDYLRRRPAEIDDLLDTNPSYVFFRVVEDGPLGSLGVKLTPHRSAAVDRRLFPDAALAVVQTNLPLVSGGTITGWKKTTRLYLLQDSGGAIKGLGRADLFFGPGEEAEVAAGNLKEPGRIFVLVHKRAVR
jgi:membrane-bound lytic murein transglycosylase A